MTNSKKNVAKVLEAMIKNNEELYELCKDSDKEWAKLHLRTATDLQAALNLLTDRKYFNDMARIYEVEEE